MKGRRERGLAAVLMTGVGSVLLFVIWFSVKFGFHVPDRYLPSPVAVYRAIGDLEPSFWYHCGVTALRLLVGSVLGVVVGSCGVRC